MTQEKPISCKVAELNRLIGWAREIILKEHDNQRIIKQFKVQYSQHHDSLIKLERRCLSLSRTLLLVLEHDKSGEAYVIERALIEATTKLLYILTGGKECGKRLAEFCVVHALIQMEQDYKDVKRIADYISNLTISDPKASSMAGKIFQNSEDFRVDADRAAEIPKDIKRQVREDWKIYSLMTSVFGNSINFADIMKRYMLSSHVSHSNWPSLQMIAEEWHAEGSHVSEDRLRIAATHLDQCLMYSFLRRNTVLRISPSMRGRRISKRENELMMGILKNEFFDFPATAYIVAQFSMLGTWSQDDLFEKEIASRVLKRDAQ